MTADVTHLIRVRKAMDYMDQNYSHPIQIADVARYAGYSTFHFVRSFKLAYGESPGLYLTRRRIERAKFLLGKEPETSITGIAFEVGYRSLGSFSAKFRSVVGVSPREYRKGPAMPELHIIPAYYIHRWTRPYQPAN